MNKDYRILEFVSTFKVNNKAGRIIKMHDRYSATFIFPLSGKIEFSTESLRIYTDNKQPLYIPRGANYINRCINDADSIMFNIYDINGYKELTSLPATPTANILEIYNNISNSCNIASDNSEFYIFSQLYNMLHHVFKKKSLTFNPLLIRAIEYINSNYHKHTLSLSQVAQSANISTVYLSKLFSKELNITPFKYLTKIRMSHALELLKELCSIGEIAEHVGYSDIYQFSRAFKKFYGCSPKQMSK